MFRKGMRQAAALTISALLVVSASAFAAGSHTGPKPAAVVEKGYEGLFARAWQWVQALWAEEGACLDPNGKCTSVPAPSVHTDAGGCMDPDGKPCAASPHS